MTDESPIQHVAAALFAEAAAQQTWPLALEFLALAPTNQNVEAFRRRATDSGVAIAHLRWRRNWDGITREEFCQAAESARTYKEVLDRLGLKPGGSTYKRLEVVAGELGVALPTRLQRGQIPGQRRSSFSCTDEAVRDAYSDARSMADLLRRIGLVPKGGNYRVMRKRLIGLGLDPHLLNGQGWAAGKTLGRQSLSEMLQRGQKCDGPRLALRLVVAGILERRCAICHLTEWLGQPIPLELDHINGEHDDNRLENLRLLCPNCHALTPTYRGRNVRARRARRLTSTPEC